MGGRNPGPGVEIKGPISKLYVELEEVFYDAYGHWHEEEIGTRDGYWQGKKDGLRIALNLLHPLAFSEGGNEDER